MVRRLALVSAQGAVNDVAGRVHIMAIVAGKGVCVADLAENPAENCNDQNETH